MAEEFAKRFYASKAWRELRFNLILQRGQVCARCGRLIGNTSLLIGHHKIHLTKDNISDCEITLNPKNIDLICFDCHNAEHRRYGEGAHQVYIVYGSPLSGKRALVNQLFERGDMLLDIDALYQSVSGLPLYDKPNNLRYNVFALRDKTLDMIATRYGQWHDAYVIGGYPTKEERERLAAKLGAQLVYCEATREGCLQRAAQRGVAAAEWTAYVEKWWDAATF